MYITGDKTTLMSRMHELASTTVDVSSYVQEGDAYLANITPQASGQLEKEARLKDYEITMNSSYLNTQMLSLVSFVSVTWNPTDPNNTSGESFAGNTEVSNTIGNGQAYNQMDFYSYQYNSGDHVHVVVSYTAGNSPATSSIGIETVDGAYQVYTDFQAYETGIAGDTITVDFVATQNGMLHGYGTTTDLNQVVVYDFTISPS